MSGYDDLPGAQANEDSAASGRPLGSALIPGGWSAGARALAGAAGAGLLGWAVVRRGRAATVLGALGAGLVARGLIGRRAPLSRSNASTVRVHTGILVDVPVRQAYAFWTDLSNLERVFSHLDSVEPLGGDVFRFIGRGPGGAQVEWDAVITKREPDRLIAWRSQEGSMVVNRGGVRFESVAPGRTWLDIWMTYSPPAGALGHLVALASGRDPGRVLRQELRRVKEVLEEGGAQLGSRPPDVPLSQSTTDRPV